ncbi:hypothetical protein [Flavihumibacter petaseus]|uniref:Uncharacterized protein n=1 Tax=Flavihumibacter petaseus NBRC 106054 TaxID=1220578 RepID=A0A0E9MVC0_9BACT|nr:hypothetical protein [Flavihumibacter petaseus]GAO41524.1 hypothetical protein FPE01S_01_05380 [Flavihumibacter petaseus NBRC 106054]
MNIATLRKAGWLVALVTLLAGISGFTRPLGGIQVTVTLKGQPAAERHYGQKDPVKTIHLNKLAPSDELVIRSSYCGTLGRKAAIALVDQSNRKLYEWAFDEGAAKDGMAITVEQLRKIAGGQESVQLVYIPKELPNSIILLTLA